MALKESNKNRTKIKERIEDDTCSYITRLIIGSMMVLGGIVAIINAFVFPKL